MIAFSIYILRSVTTFLGIGVVIRNCDILYILGDSWPYLFLGHTLVFNEKKNQIYRHVEQTLKREKL